MTLSASFALQRSWADLPSCTYRRSGYAKHQCQANDSGNVNSINLPVAISPTAGSNWATQATYMRIKFAGQDIAARLSQDRCTYFEGLNYEARDYTCTGGAAGRQGLIALHDGFYRTFTTHGSPNAIRDIRIVEGVVHLNGHRFSQEDFFKVNQVAE